MWSLALKSVINNTLVLQRATALANVNDSSIRPIQSVYSIGWELHGTITGTGTAIAMIMFGATQDQCYTMLWLCFRYTMLIHKMLFQSSCMHTSCVVFLQLLPFILLSLEIWPVCWSLKTIENGATWSTSMSFKHTKHYSSVWWRYLKRERERERERDMLYQSVGLLCFRYFSYLAFVKTLAFGVYCFLPNLSF